jgi:c-di-GMP-related signal transduction protein
MSGGVLSMHVFLARQPILDKKQRILAYEVFYRSGFANVYTGDDHDGATSKVIIDTFHNLGLCSLTSGKPAFINFPATLLKKEVATLFPSEQLVVEVLESVTGSKEVLEKCRELKAAGYTLALDDFVYSEDSEPFLDLADIVKIDLLVTDASKLRETVNRLQNSKVRLLAEKVETYEAFQMAAEHGFTMFQGYFFSRPEMVLAKALAPFHLVCLQLIVEASKDEVELDRLTDIISRDVSLSYSLLRLANSAVFARRHPTKTVKQALVYLGQKEVRKWVSLIALQRMCKTELQAPVITSLIRGRFAELIAAETSFAAAKGTLFLCGLFSLLDVLLQRPLMDILEEIKAPSEVMDLLVHGKGPYKELGALVLAYERGHWDKVQMYSKKLDMAPELVAKAYLQAVEWCPQSS